MKGTGIARIRVWEGASLWVVDVVPGAGAPAHVTDFHSHHAIQITLSLGGRIEHRTADGRVAGHAIVAADAKHLLEAEGSLAVLFVEPESDMGRAVAATHLRGAPLAPLAAAPIAGCLRRLADAVPAFSRNRAAFEDAGRALLAELTGVARAPVLDARVQKMIAHAAAHLDRAVTLPSAAGAAALSPSRARHLFVAQTGLPFRTYLLWLRIMKAVAAMAAGQTLTAAAHEAGFCDSAHFSRTFRRMFGISAASLRIN